MHLIHSVPWVKIFKGVTSLRLFKKAWRVRSPSYYVGTAGNVSSETIEKYIQAQQSKRDSSTG
ncbi:MAG: transposase [Nitrososphaeraceae archaeon]